MQLFFPIVSSVKADGLFFFFHKSLNALQPRTNLAEQKPKNCALKSK